MTIKDILAKVNKGEALTDDEKKFLGQYDHQRELDAAAAGARKKAEGDAEKALADLAAAQQQLKDLQGKLDEAGSKGKTDSQRTSEQLAAMQKQVETLTKQVETAGQEKARLVRQQKLADVIRTSGLQFVKEVDGQIMRGALEREFEQLTDADLDVADKVKPVLDTFRARNKAVILDDSRPGAGTPPKDGSDAAARQKKIEEQSPEERRADLKKQGII